jgi:outer membrane receptor protein involved in Fe transport
MKTRLSASISRARVRAPKLSPLARALPLTAAALIAAGGAGAQELEEIVVTARFRSENLQEIPLAISAIVPKRSRKTVR